MGVSNDNAAATQMGKVSTRYAIWVGFLWLRLPRFVIEFGGIFALIVFGTFYVAGLGVQPSDFNLTIFLVCCCVPPIGAGWLWLAFNRPKWRIWALKHADDWDAVKRRAVRWRLIWDERRSFGKYFGWFEIWSRKDRARYEELLRARTPVTKPEAP
jgi:hypothetical protein